MSLEKKSDEKRREGGGGCGRSVWLVWWGWSGERGNGGGTGTRGAEGWPRGCARSTTSGCGTHAHWLIGVFCVEVC